MSARVIRDIVMPQLGMGMSEGTITEWLVEEGAMVDRDDPLVSIETEKVLTELPAPYAGFVHIIGVSGDTIPIDTLIAKIAETEQDYQTLRSGVAAAPSTVTAAPQDEEVAPGPSADAHATTFRSERPIASGLAKSLARQHGIGLTDLTGTGPRGRIVKADILAVIAAKDESASPPDVVKEAPRPASPAQALVVDRTLQRQIGGERRVHSKIPFQGARRTIASRMVRSSSEAAQTFTFFEIDVTDLFQTRERIDARRGDVEGKVSALAYYAKAVSLACQRVPIANATLEDDQITLWEEVNVGIAVAMPGSGGDDSSLVVPVIRNADRLGVDGLNRQIRQQVRKTREGSATAADFADGTITISSNAGFFPGMWVYTTPLLNMPQAIIFQPGNATKRPVVIDDEIVIRTILPCSMTFDHRILDGEPAARFIREVSGFLSTPETMIL